MFVLTGLLVVAILAFVFRNKIKSLFAKKEDAYVVTTPVATPTPTSSPTVTPANTDSSVK